MVSLVATTDDVLISLLREGDEDAYTEIYNRYKWPLHAHAYKKLGDRDAANDVVQDLFTNLWLKREDVFLTTTLSAYLYTSIRNRVLNIIEHRVVESKYMDSLVEFVKDFVPPADHLVRQNELRAIIDKEISALPPKMREVFELSRKSNLTHKEIALQLSISEQTVTKQIKNALKILKIRLGLIVYIVLISRM